MLGHKQYQVADEERNEVFGTMRQRFDDFARFGIFRRERIFDNVDVNADSDIQRVVSETKPDIVINCAGLIKPLAKDILETIEVNSVFPHKLARICSRVSAKLVQISTDCVFSGAKGQYSEESTPDPVDLYGRTKLLGEVTYNDHLTIRTSMIGRELCTKRNLVEWFLSQSGEVQGYTQAIFSGLTTRPLSRVILELARRNVNGLVHVASEPTSKYDLLCLLKELLDLKDISIAPYEEVRVDRSLAAPKLKALGIKVPSMRIMIQEMVAENEFYEKMNQNCRKENLA